MRRTQLVGVSRRQSSAPMSQLPRRSRRRAVAAAASRRIVGALSCAPLGAFVHLELARGPRSAISPSLEPRADLPPLPPLPCRATTTDLRACACAAFVPPPRASLAMQYGRAPLTPRHTPVALASNSLALPGGLTDLCLCRSSTQRAPRRAPRYATCALRWAVSGMFGAVA